jgi:hypothetical protein
MSTTILTPARRMPFAEMIASDTPDAETMRLINAQATRKGLAPEDVHVRGAFGVHDFVDYYFSRFTKDSVRTLVDLAPGVPGIVGHRDDTKPLVRLFRGEVVKRDVAVQRLVPGVGEGIWGRFDYFWMRQHSGANDLALEIDGGIVKEVSVRWAFDTPTCSICSSDLRECDHMPGRDYKGTTCWYSMDGVKRFSEMSFVYRGGQQSTETILARSGEGRSATEVVDALAKDLGIVFEEEERAGLLEFARCYDGSRKLAKRDRAGWFDSLRRKREENNETRGTTWFRNDK